MKFLSPNYTQVPNAIIDELMQELSPAEFKCMMLIIRKTFGFHRQKSPISITEFQNKCGLSRQGVLNSTKSLKEKGLIKTLNIGRGRCTVYCIEVEEDLQYKEDKEVVNSVDQDGQLSRPDVVNSVDCKQESVKKEERKIKETTTDDSKTKGPEKPRKESKVVVSLFDGIKGLGEVAAQKLFVAYSVKQLEKAVRVLKLYSAPVPNPYGFIKKAIEKRWEEPVSGEDAKKELVAKNKELATKKFGTLKNRFNVCGVTVFVEVFSSYVEVFYGQKSFSFEYDDAACMTKLKKCLEKCGISIKM